VYIFLVPSVSLLIFVHHFLFMIFLLSETINFAVYSMILLWHNSVELYFKTFFRSKL